MHPPVELEDELTVEHVERLFERMHVGRQPATRCEHADGEFGVDRSLVTTYDDLPAEP